MKIIVSAMRGHFQRPGNPGEPSTYPVITPTAAEGLINAVYWHPGLSVQIREISVLAPIEYTTETVKQLDHRNGDPWLRTYELVVNPCYLIDFWVKCDAEINEKKTIGILTNRLLKGQHYYQPCMGISDYAADVQLLAKDEPPPKALDITFPIGPMPHYWVWADKVKAGVKPFARRSSSQGGDRPLKNVSGKAATFNAWVRNGLIEVPAYPDRGVGGYAS